MGNFSIINKVFLGAVFCVAFIFLAEWASAANVGDDINFNVDKNFDSLQRSQVLSTLIKISNNLYFYVEKEWWYSQTQSKQNEITSKLQDLSQEFDSKIYPTLTSNFGFERKPGIDGDNRVTVLFERMNSNEGGYFREADGYDRLELPTSNAREMVYLSLDKIEDPQLKVILAHEFTHLIIFNQKNKIFGAEEDVWLNEARADYSSTILGYNDNYEGSSLQQRVNDFIQNPSDSMAEWSGTKYDYATASLFVHYLVDQYGINILSDSLKSKYSGIDSINYSLQKFGYKEDFGKIFSNWTIASVINNCSVSSKYCYSNPNLKKIRLAPSLNFLPLTGNISLSVTNVTKNWSGNWLKFIGGNGDLRISFSSLRGLDFKIPYIVEDNNSNYTVKFFILNKEEKGEISIPKFGSNYKSLIIIPALQSKTSGFDSQESEYPFTYAVFIEGSQPTEDQEIIQKLLDQITSLKKQIADIIAQKSGAINIADCSRINSNLSIGIMNNAEVKCLQKFLKSQGSDIYPEGYITGNFSQMTRNAVIRFQDKYKDEILVPLGLQKGTGIVGPATRLKINQLLNVG